MEGGREGGRVGGRKEGRIVLHEHKYAHNHESQFGTLFVSLPNTQKSESSTNVPCVRVRVRVHRAQKKHTQTVQLSVAGCSKNMKSISAAVKQTNTFSLQEKES